MPLPTGTHIGPYQVVASLGAGGMGEVYRARDSRLERDVALKALPAAFARDPERIARFEREAKLLASLNHPNIGAILGLEEAAGQRYLVLEYVEGETLAARLARGPLSLSDALDVCRQVAAGVEAAHESGVVHRDLKPGNVMLRPDGTVKVLDFGLAKGGVTGAASSDPGLSASPTVTHTPTGAGVILGTAAYMSPEQARGKAVDRRTDIWSFGCVLYECLTGRALFAGETVSDLIARILEREPDWSALPASTPPRVRWLLRRCLAKDPRERLRDIGEARIALDEPVAGAHEPGIASVGAPARRTPWLIAGASLVVAAAALAFALAAARRPAPRPLRVSVLAPEDVDVSIEVPDIVIAPDARSLVISALDTTGVSHLWLRPLDAMGWRELPGTDGARQPFWSPDSRQIGFVADGHLKCMPIDGEGAQTLCAAPEARGAAWSRSGMIVFAPTGTGPLMAVPATGGEPHPVTALDSTRGEAAHRFPAFLPDGEHFLYSALTRQDPRTDTRVGSLDGRSGPVLLSADCGCAYAPPGYLVFLRGGVVLAQHFDARSLRLEGATHPIRDVLDVVGTYDGEATVTVANDGTLLQREPVRDVFDARILDRAGRVQRSIPLPEGVYVDPRLARDGSRFLATRLHAGEVTSPLWMVDLARGTVSRFTFDGQFDVSPLWTHDGRAVLYGSARRTGQLLCRKRIDGGGEERVAQLRDQFSLPSDLSPDDRTLIYVAIDGATGEDVWTLPLGGGRPAPLLATRFNEMTAALSPDGRWIAYRSDESGRFEVYVQPYPSLDRKWRVSTEGTTPLTDAPVQLIRWRQDGRELFFLGRDGASLMAVVVEPGPEPRFGTPHVLLRLPRGCSGVDVSPDGQRILVCAPANDPGRVALDLILHWSSEMGGR